MFGVHILLWFDKGQEGFLALNEDPSLRVQLYCNGLGNRYLVRFPSFQMDLFFFSLLLECCDYLAEIFLIIGTKYR